MYAKYENTETCYTLAMSRIRSFLKQFGPGIITGASDDDPSGIATYSQTGAGFGFSILWIALWALPFMIVVQEMCARIAMATGRGLITNMRKHNSKRTTLIIAGLLFIANSLNVGADLGMMAASTRLLVPVPFWGLLIGITLITLLLQIFLSYKTYSKYLKWLCFSLFAYVIVVGMIHVDWKTVAWSTFIPQINFASKEYWLMLIAVLGTTISPYLYFWQASQEVEEQRENGCLDSKDNPTGLCDFRQTVKLRRVDVTAGMVFSNLIAWFIMITAATLLFKNGGVQIETADQAAKMLEPFAGRGASALFAAGIFGTGLLAVPVLTCSAAHAVSEVLGWNSGLSKKWHEAKAFYTVITLSTLVGLTIHLLGLSPVRALIYAAVANALIAPIMLLFVVRIADDRKIMGKLQNNRFSSAIGYAACVLMGVAALIWVGLSVFG